jgi:hypothetical protein
VGSAAVASTDLGVTEWLPQRPAVRRQREQREHGRGRGDEDRAQPHDARIDEGDAQGRSFLVLLLDEVEEDDDVAHDDADEADDAEP